MPQPSVFANYVHDPERDGFAQADIPKDVQAELLQCATAKRIDFYWLCSIYRMALQAGLASHPIRTEKAEQEIARLQESLDRRSRDYNEQAERIEGAEEALVRVRLDTLTEIHERWHFEDGSGNQATPTNSVTTDRSAAQESSSSDHPSPSVEQADQAIWDAAWAMNDPVPDGRKWLRSKALKDAIDAYTAVVRADSTRHQRGDE